MPLSDRTPRPVEVRALEPYRIWLRYDDGVEGEVDLSDVSSDGVFAAWEDHSFFAGVHLALPARSPGATASTCAATRCT